MPKTPALFILFVTLALGLLAQDRCGFDFLHQQRLKNDPDYAATVAEQNKWISNYVKSHQDEWRNLPTAALYTIPVVIHVVHTGGAVGTLYNPTDAQIQGAIAYLNQVYDGSYPGTEGVGDIQIRFELARRDPSCNLSTGITRTDASGVANYTANGVNLQNTTGADQLTIKNLVRWDPSRYYNIWVVNRIDGMDGTSGTFVGGFAYLPGAPANYDGTIMLATQMQTGQKTLPHEIGHAFGLYHTFEDGTSTCPPNADCTQDGDMVCDTDPVTLPASFACRTGTNSCTGTPYFINTEHNYMNYTACATLFTAGQKARMLATLASPLRNTLAAGWGAAPNYPLNPYLTPLAAGCTPVTNPLGLSDYYAGLLNITIGNWIMNSGTTRDDGGYLNGTTSCNNLMQLVRGNTYSFSLQPYSVNWEQLRGWVDYNNDGNFDNATEQFVLQDNIGPPAALSLLVNGNITIPVSAVTNTVLRMRVTEELGTVYGGGFQISGGCYNPVYGQAEDYPLLIMAENALPVQYEYLKGQLQGANVLISWKTIEEINADRYIIERAQFGESFREAGQVAALHKKDSRYQFIDPDPGVGQWFYRLRQMDRDGSSRYSHVLHVSIEPDSRDTRVLTNPFQNTIEIQPGKSFQGALQIRLLDLSGRQVYAKKLVSQNNRTLRLDLSGHTLQAGVYLLELKNGFARETFMLIRN